MPFSLHGTAYDPPAPTIAPAPATAPIVASASNPDDVPNTSMERNTNTSGNGNGRAAGNRMSVVQAEIDETVAIMRGNLQSLAERGERLESLESRTGTSLLVLSVKLASSS